MTSGYDKMNFPTNILTLSLLLFAVVAIISAFYSVFHGFRLLSYVKKVDYFRWEELTSIGKLGPGLQNAFRTIPYIYSDTDNQDKRIARHKGAIRTGNCYFVITFLAFFFDMWLIFYLKK